MRRISFDQGADEICDLVRDCDAETLAAIYEGSFGCITSVEVDEDTDSLVIYDS